MNLPDPAIAFAKFFQLVALGMVALLLLFAVLGLVAWCWDRWCRRGCGGEARLCPCSGVEVEYTLTQAVTGAPSATPTGESRPEGAAVGHSNDGPLSGVSFGSPSGLQSEVGLPERAVGAAAPAANFPCHLVTMDTLSVAATLRRNLPWLVRTNLRLAREYSLCRWVTDEALNELRKGARP